MACPPELRKLYREGRLIPFIGAGVSMSVSWTDGGIPRRGPSWKELVDEVARHLGFEDADLLRVRGTDLQILEYLRIRNQGRPGHLANWLYSAMRPPDSALKDSLLHQRLAALKNCQRIYTTNYDDFLERALTLLGRPTKAVVVEEHLTGNRDTCEIIKFHGDLAYPDLMVLSESDYERRLKLSTPLDYKFVGDLLGNAVLFLGYSFRDNNVSYLFRLIYDQFKGLPGSSTGRRAYIAVPDPSDFETKLFAARNIEVIPISGMNPSGEIAQLLKEMAD